MNLLLSDHRECFKIQNKKSNYHLYDQQGVSYKYNSAFKTALFALFYPNNTLSTWDLNGGQCENEATANLCTAPINKNQQLAISHSTMG